MASREAEAFLARYEALKRQYFSRRPQTGADDNPPAGASRAQIAEMFENMFVEVPQSPDDPPVPLPANHPKRQQQYR